MLDTGTRIASGLTLTRQYRHTLTMADPEKTQAAGSPNDSPVATFEQALDELEMLVQRMEVGDLALEDSLSAYERGIALYRQCRGALDQAELRVRQLADPLDPESAENFEPDAG